MTATSLLVLAQETTHKTLWNPTILGYLVVLSAIGLFCGSVYLLLATNLGARLGFLVTVASLSGFLVLLNLLWITSATPLDPPHGHPPLWKVVDVADTLQQSKIGAVHDIATRGAQVTGDQLANLRPAIDAALVTPAATTAAKPSPFATFASSAGYLTDLNGKPFRSYVVGGGTKSLFWHHARYAAVELCPVRQVTVAPGAVPPPPTCDPLAGTQYAILVYNFGTLRQPVALYLVMFSGIFALSLLGLHWWELDERARKRAALTPVRPPAPTT